MAAGLRRRGLKGAAKRGSDAGLRRRQFNLDDLTIQGVEVRRGKRLSFHHHREKRLIGGGSFVGFMRETVKRG